MVKYAPQYLEEDTRPVSAIAPGVLGTTGIETMEVIKGIVENIRPKLIIVIDSLASRSIERISSTVQISDTGIVPGAGVGNVRSELSINTLGVPVIAIGVPMVVDAATIAADSIDIFIEKFYWMSLKEVYSSILKTNYRWKIIEYICDNDFYNAFNKLLRKLFSSLENSSIFLTPKIVSMCF